MMIDIHSHILPGVDDGAEDLEETMQMASIAVGEGILEMVATPHYSAGNMPEDFGRLVETKVAELNEAFARQHIYLNLYPGCEVMMDPELPELMEGRGICTLNHSRYVLLEFPMNHVPLFVDEVFYKLQRAGFVPIIAHPERNSEILRRPSLLQAYFDRDILFQINTSSLKGLLGEKVHKTAWRMVENGIAHFVATDAHNTDTRPPVMDNVFELLAKRAGYENAILLLRENARRVLLDKPVKNMDIYNKKRTKQINSVKRFIQRFMPGA